MGSSIKSSAYEYRIWMPDKLRMNPFYVERVHKSNGTKTLLTKTFASTGDAIQWIRCLDKHVTDPEDVKIMFDVEKMRDERARNIERNKQRFREAKANAECVLCGSKDDLSFHHVDPSLKKYSFQELIVWGSIEELDAELSKTVVLCTRHHRLLHAAWIRETNDSICQRCIWRRGLQCRCKRPDVWCASSGILITGSGVPVKR